MYPEQRSYRNGVCSALTTILCVHNSCAESASIPYSPYLLVLEESANSPLQCFEIEGIGSNCRIVTAVTQVKKVGPHFG